MPITCGKSSAARKVLYRQTEEAGLKRNRKVDRGLVLALVLLLLAWTNAVATDWIVTTDSTNDREGAVSDAPSIEHSVGGADSEDAGDSSERGRPPSSTERPELPPTDLGNGIPSYVPAVTLGVAPGIPQIRLGTSVIDMSPYLQPK